MSGVDYKFDTKCGEFLVDSQLVTRSALQEALKASKSSGQTLIDILIHDHGVEEVALYRALSERAGIPYKDLKQEAIDPAVARSVPVKVAWHYGFMPIRFDGTGNLIIAVEMPLAQKIQDEIRLQLGHSLLQVLSRKQDIVGCFKKYYGFAADTVDRIVSMAGFEGVTDDQEISTIENADKIVGDRTVVDLVNEIIYEALQKRATDIHFEPYRGEFRIRYRIDGVLQDANLSQKAKPIIAFILSRIKIMANLDIIEKRLPQDGRAIVKIKNQTLDLRISSIPTLNGESIVVRILPTQMIFDLKKMGLTDSNVNTFEKLIKKTSGIILLTGPTGSGKTTTLYACLNKINSKERKIITIEDPVEYEISGITQIPVYPKAGLDFAKGLRSMLRHDPDVMMVGEIRYLETAEISIRAALTGHLVLSTLHTNDAASGVSRLLDIGLEPFLVASSLDAIVAQRLVRKLCAKCKTQETSKPLALSQTIAGGSGFKSPETVSFFKEKGCEECGFTGFHGRTAIHEVLLVSEAVKQLIMKKASSYEIKALAVSEGMMTLAQDGWRKVALGETTLEEVIKVVPSDSASQPLVTVRQDEGAPVISPAGDHSDLRLYQRAAIQTKVLYVKVFYKTLTEKNRQPEVAQTTEYTGMTENICANGLLMKVDRALNTDEILDLRFETVQDPSVTLSKNLRSARTIRCLARVVRVEEAAEGRLYKVGLIFLDLSTADRAYLDDFVLIVKEETD